MVQTDGRKRTARIVAGFVVLALGGLGAYVYAGGYNVAADAPHWPATARVLEAVRERSIRARSAGIVVPNLADDALIAQGAEHYGAMCAGCHLAPGVDDTELRAGLYPKPPNLAAVASTHGHAHAARSPAEQFWIIKHGLKMTGMPAWGPTHDDAEIWGLVAFVRQLPAMHAAQYRELAGPTGSGLSDHGHGPDHDHAQEQGADFGAAAEASSLPAGVSADSASRPPEAHNHFHPAVPATSASIH